MIEVKEQIAAKIHDLIKDWAHDYASEPVYYKEGTCDITFSSVENKFDTDGKWELLTLEREKELVNKGTELMLNNFGFVYVYICKDNRIVSIEWIEDMNEINTFKEQLTLCDEIIKDRYYEGWD